MVWESIRNKIIPLSLLLNRGVEQITGSSNIGLLELTTTAQYNHAVGSYFIMDTWSNNPPAFAFGKYNSADNTVTWKTI